MATIVSLVSLLVSVGISVKLGLDLRHWTWEHTKEIRYARDMQNAWNWGTRSAQLGYFTLYDRVIAENPNGQYGLDYGPLRLAAMTLWAKWVEQHGRLDRRWQPDYTFNLPLLILNSAMELAAAAGIFALALLWLRRSREEDDPYFVCEWIALIAALMSWLNPASILSAHARPTWDVWVTPFYLWAVFAACRNAWAVSGALIGVGLLAKGQHLIVAPVFLFWPLMTLRVGAAIRWLVGCALAVGLITSPWIVGARAAPILFVSACGMAPLVIYLGWRTWSVVGGRWRERIGWRQVAFACVAMISVGLWLCVPWFGGSMAWFEIAFRYGADKFPQLEIGGASSLASILQNRFGWQSDSPVFVFPGTDHMVTMLELLAGTYYVLLVVACAAMAHAERRGSTRFLLAMAAPWIVFFAIFPRMHERYLLWGAIAACAGAARGVGPALLAILFGLLASAMILLQLLADGEPGLWLVGEAPGLGETMYQVVRRMYPDIGWAVLLAALVWLFMSIAPGEAEKWQRGRGCQEFRA